MIEIEMPAGSAEAYVARPDDDQHPGVLFFVDAIGLRPRIEEMADRIASWGYVVMAPNVFYRSGRAADVAPKEDLREPGAREAYFKQVMPRVNALTPDKSNPDTDAYLAALREQSGVSSGPIGVTGYCMGARLAVRAAGRHPDDVAACGGFHGGGLVTDHAESPHLSLATARAQFCFGHADKDRSNSPEQIATLGKALSDAGLTASNEVYEGAPHGYSMSDTPMYDEAAAERHFADLRTLLDRALS